MERKEYDLDDLKKYYPDPNEIKDMSEYDVYTLKNHIEICKFVKADLLTFDEKQTFGKKLNDEWMETVVKPYLKALYEFCDKYEIAPMKTIVGTQAMPLFALAMKEMLEDVSNTLRKKIDEE